MPPSRRGERTAAPMTAPAEPAPVDFSIIESHKENIQALPSGRSARKLADLFTRSPLAQQATPTSLANRPEIERARAEFEEEIKNLGESDDPLDVYDRYVKWTLDTFPSAQNTKESGLGELLERATREFVRWGEYKNDVRYLRLWVYYIQWFCDAPREAFVYLARNGIGEGLAMYYEEYAGWLESVGRWAQAEEVWKLGIEREARPVGRLVRKFGEFERRWERVRQEEGEEGGPRSPAIPPVRRALAERVDPFSLDAAPRDPQAQRQDARGVGGAASKPKSKLQIFSDADSKQQQPAIPAKSGSGSSASSKGWDSIDTMANRKKENVMEPKPWAGETLKQASGTKKPAGPKLQVFRDPTLDHKQKLLLAQSHIPIHHSKLQVTVNPATGKKERVFVDLRAVYPTPDEPGTELSFEEVWARNRGWLDVEWESEEEEEAVSMMMDETAITEMGERTPVAGSRMVRLDENGNPILTREVRNRKKKVIEVNETQIIKVNLDSPTGPRTLKKKKKRRSTIEPSVMSVSSYEMPTTMTIHTKEAQDDIYDIFNAPEAHRATGEISQFDRQFESDDYTCGETTYMTNKSSVRGDITRVEEEDEDGEEENDGASEWSEFSRKDVHGLDGPSTADTTGNSDLIDMREDCPPQQSRPRSSFIPVPPEDYVPPPRRPYRDPTELASRRLPFMTPITERTETSLTCLTAARSVLGKTPCRDRKGASPLMEEEEEEEEEDAENQGPESPSRGDGFGSGRKMRLPMMQKSVPVFREEERSQGQAGQRRPFAPKPAQPLAPKTPLAPKGPVIKEQQVNPMDEGIRLQILKQLSPSLTSYGGFFDNTNQTHGRAAEIRKYIKTISKNRSSTDKAASSLNGTGIVLSFPGAKGRYTIRRELGAGAFAPVYLVDNSAPDEDEDEQSETHDENAVIRRGSPYLRRRAREAIKMEDPPSTSAWEFYMMRLAHSRLGPQHRATASLSPALELHLYRDEGFLVMPYYPHGTLLDVVNFFRSAESSGVMDEVLAMFFAIEVLRTVEALHTKGILHGDLKPDNCLLRLPDESDVQNQHLVAQWTPSGAGGWAARGIVLIDFGRAIDMKMFRDDVAFIADWKTTPQDCAEMREGRSWTWQIDYHGIAGILYCLLFGKYIETVRVPGGNGRRYRIRESLKRYWQQEIWSEAFDLLLNPGEYVGGEEGGRMPCLRGMRRVRERMEGWLVTNCERGAGLRGLMGKVEGWVRGRRR